MSAADGAECSDGWRITGYYTPEEAEFEGARERIQLPDGTADEFPMNFLRRARLEGWARTRHGWFLGWSAGKWVRGDAPLNAHGRPLHIGSLATDREVIRHGHSVTIPSAPGDWGTRTYVADDTGSAIVGKHVDIYCGVGAAAHAETLRVTSDAGRVCYAVAMAGGDGS